MGFQLENSSAISYWTAGVSPAMSAKREQKWQQTYH